jgi:hypothetical protein
MRVSGAITKRFTGSVAVGQGIMRDGAETMKRVTLELGGKSPTILPGFRGLLGTRGDAFRSGCGDLLPRHLYRCGQGEDKAGVIRRHPNIAIARASAARVRHVSIIE